jgi:hypothetical protein
MDKLTVITVCVNYTDYLKQTIARTLEISDHYLIVTDKADDETAKLADEHNVGLLRTNAFYDNGADFNKGLAIELAFAATHYSGWYLVLDADILLPKTPATQELIFGNLGAYSVHDLYGMRRTQNGRRINDKELAGYFQLFHSDSKFLTTKPWYGTNWRHAGGCDSMFQAKYPPEHKQWLPGFVEHLGEPGVNWCGRTPEAQAKLKNYRILRRQNQSYKAEQL